jgi:hypothetical protein
MAIAGVILVLARYKAIRLRFAENWEEEYRIGDQAAAQPVEVVEEKKARRAPKEHTPEEKAEAARIRMEKLIGRKTINSQESKPPAKKSS